MIFIVVYFFKVLLVEEVFLMKVCVEVIGYRGIDRILIIIYVDEYVKEIF